MIGSKSLQQCKQRLFENSCLEDFRQIILSHPDLFHPYFQPIEKINESRYTDRRLVEKSENSISAHNHLVKRNIFQKSHNPLSPWLREKADGRDWKHKTVDLWTPKDVVEWVINQLFCFRMKNPVAVSLEEFINISGKELVLFGRDKFEKIIPEYGTVLYHQLQVKIKLDLINNNPQSWERISFSTLYPPSQEKPLDLNTKTGSYLQANGNTLSNFQPTDLKIDCEIKSLDNWTSNDVSDTRTNSESEKISCKHPHLIFNQDQPLDFNIKSGSYSSTLTNSGRVRRVWEFIRDLLLDPNCRHIISWEDPALGVFRFENSALVAKLWGHKRGNSRMNFKKFSRAIRYNYNMGYLLPVEKTRLVYKFGAKATGWRQSPLR